MYFNILCTKAQLSFNIVMLIETGTSLAHYVNELLVNESIYVK